MDSLYYRKQKGSRSGGFAPFLLIVGAVIIIVFLFQFFFNFKAEEQNAIKSKVYITPDKNSTDFLAWGENKWRKSYDGLVLVSGDSVRTHDDSYATLTFYDGSRVRLNENTELVVEEIDVNSKHIAVKLHLKIGEIWVNEVRSDDLLNFTVNSDHQYVTSKDAIYGFAQGPEGEFTRNVRGDVHVEVKDTSLEDPELLETAALSIGQQVSLTKDDIDQLEARTHVGIMDPVDDYWRVTEWFIWNSAQDELPPKRFDVKSVEQPTADNAQIEQAPSVPMLTVISPEKNPYDLEGDQIYMKGTVAPEVSKIVVTEFYKDPKGTPYPLQKFVPGSGKWSYAASFEYGNLVPGKNRFVFQAYSGDGLAYDPVEVVVNALEDKITDDVMKVEADTASTQDSDEALTTEVPSTENEIITSPSQVTSKESDTTNSAPAPQVTGSLSINSIEFATTSGMYKYVTSADRVVVHGKCPVNTSKLIVNNYALSLFKAGDTSFTYYAKSEIGTLNVGVNNYKIKAVDENGNILDTLNFTIEKNK